MKPILIAIMVSILATSCGHRKIALTKTEDIPSEQITVPSMLQGEIPEFCVVLNPQFTYTGYLCTIYNRWGAKIWQTDEVRDCWDANITKKEVTNPVPAGVYYVVIEIAATNGKRYANKSTLTVVR